MTAPISFSGLASGIDTNSIIEQTLEASRIPITRLENKTQVLAVQREAYRDVNTQLLALQDEALDLRLESTFLTRSASSSDESSVAATAGFASVKTTHRLEVSQLAQEAIASSSRYLSETRLLGSNTMGINLLGGANRTNAPGAGRIKGDVALDESTTLGDLGLAGDFTLRIDPDGDGSHSAVAIKGLDASTTVGQMLTKIREQVGPVKAHVVYDEATGGNVLQISSKYVGIDLSVSGAVAEATLGIDNGQTVNTSSGSGAGSSRTYGAISPSDMQQGEYTVISSDGLAGSLTGSVDLETAAAGGDVLAITLDDLNVNDFDPLLIDPDGAGGTGSVEILKSDGTSLSGTDTIGDLVDAINHSVPDVTAQVVEGPAGASYLKISANEGGRDFAITETGANNGILKRVFGLGADNHTTSNATTSSDDVMLMAKFFPRGNLEASSRRAISGLKDDFRVVGVNDLIEGVTLLGSNTGSVFTPGSARIQLNNSDSLSVDASYKSKLFGRTGITDASYATGLSLDSDNSGVIGLNKTISELSSASAFSFDDGLGIKAGTFVVGDTTLSIAQDEIDNGLTISQVMARINSANEGISVSYDSGADRFVAVAGAFGSQQEISFANYAGGDGESNVLKVLGLTNAPADISISAGLGAGRVDSESELIQAGFSVRPNSGTFSINGISIEVDATADTLTEVIEKINTSAAGVTANLDPVSNRVTLLQDVDSDTTANWITVGSSSDTSNILEVLRITGGANADSSITSTERRTSANNVGSERKTAELKVDNVQYTRNTNSIDDITSGLTYDLRGVSDSPVTISVVGDTEKPLEQIAQWVTEYNKTIKLLDPEALEKEEQQFLTPLTDEQRSNMTYDELINHLDKFDLYNKQEIIRKESNFRILKDQMRSAVFNQVDIPGSNIRSIADLGIGTGSAGSPLTSDYQGVLVADSTDYDEILEVLQDNETLKKRLEEDDHSVYKLFAQRANSEVQVKGTSVFEESTALANDIVFQISDGTTSTEITLPSGTSNPNEILSTITNRLNSAGLTELEASFDTTGHLRFDTTTDVGRAYLRIFDLTDTAETDSLSSRFGITGGSFIGEDADRTAGVAEKSYSVLRDSTSLSGFISQKASYGGTYSQGSIFDEIVALQEHILQIEERVAQREESLRKQYAAMESSLTRLQEQQSALSQLGAAASANFLGS
jgi:flagellar capping protein FliD